MPRRVDEDRQQYRRIIRGELHKELKGLIRTGKLLGRRAKDGRFIVSIPSIDMPDFRFGRRSSGVGRGKGKKGDVIGKDPQKGGEGNKPGDEPGEHTLVAVDLDEVLDMLQQELDLPNIEPKQNPKFTIEHYRYTGIRRTGPDSLRHTRRTMKEAMLRMIESGEYDEDDPVIIPLPEDMRYKSWKVIKKPISNAVTFFVRDYSGSIGQQKRDIISDCSWWIDHWITKFYEKTERVYIGHDTEARILDHQKFYGFTSGGGTKISSAFELIQEQIELIYDPELWNIYIFYFSDLENWGDDDNGKALRIMKANLDKVNLYGLVGVMSYLQEFSTLIGKAKTDKELISSGKLRTYNLKSSSEKMSVIKALLGKKTVSKLQKSDSHITYPDEMDYMGGD